jgi:hypothetical protein
MPSIDAAVLVFATPNPQSSLTHCVNNLRWKRMKRPSLRGPESIAHLISWQPMKWSSAVWCLILLIAPCNHASEALPSKRVFDAQGCALTLPTPLFKWIVPSIAPGTLASCEDGKGRTLTLLAMPTPRGIPPEREDGHFV